MPIERHIVLHNQLSELNTLATEIERFAEQAQLDMQTQFQLNLVLDELLTNIISYAYDDKVLHSISLRLSYVDHVLQAQLCDDGKAFDPTQIGSPDFETGNTVEERQVGGLGIHFARTFMDTVEYQRRDSHNQLVLSKKLFERKEADHLPTDDEN